jgi:hypothetical protein
MPLTNWKVLLRGVDQTAYQYAATLHRTSVPAEAEEVLLRLEGQRIKCVITEVRRDFVTRAGVEVFTVRANEIASPDFEPVSRRAFPTKLTQSRFCLWRCCWIVKEQQ